MKKRLAVILTILLAAVSIFGCGGKNSSSSSETNNSSNTDDSKVYQLHAAYAVAEDENSQHTIKFNKFKELVEERTEGKVQIMMHPSGELGSEKEYVEMLQNGEIAFASIATSWLSGFSPALAFYDCPFLFKSQDQVVKFTHTDIADARLEQLKEIGIVGMAATSVGARNFLTIKDKPITSLADMTGLKLRTMSTEMQIEAVEILGAEATPLAYSECYQSIQTGVIDGMENEVDTYLAMKFYEVAPNYTKANWLQLVHTFVASKEIMDSLPQEYQDIILKAAREAADYATEKGIEYANTTAKEALADAKVNVIELDNTEFNDALQKGGFFTKYGELIGNDVLDWIEAN